MLGQRVVTALVLLALLVPSIFLAPPWVWGLVSLAALAIGAAEWGRLLGSAGGGRALGAALVAGGLGYVAWRSGTAPGSAPPTLVAVLAGASLAFWLSIGPLSLARVHRVGPGWAVAALVLAAAWIALYELRLAGAATLVSAMAIVWLADIGAYFAGRAFGRHKLAPRVSPGKTWEGVAGGIVAVLAVAAGVAIGWPGSAGSGAQAPGVFSSWLAARAGLLPAALVLAAIAGLSVVGDLYESLLKRLAGVKDSGTLLPGHGGILDRIDALIPTMPGCLLLLQVLR
ncbi:MAG: Phosphatidate cytidylyltransferase [Pseudomonadota bacterium]